MMKNRWAGIALAGASLLVGIVCGQVIREPAASAQQQGDRKGEYYPNTEQLAADEMRVTALGTGMPNATKAQKASGWLVELGNGDMFLFDIGTGSIENLTVLRPDFAKIDKVFASHLHTDHIGDFDALWIGGWLQGRYTPLHIYGPTGSDETLGTQAFADNLRAALKWDVTGRSGRLPDAGGEVVVHEFDYKAAPGVVYEQNGVRIISFPAIHVQDGAVSFKLEWNGLTFVFGGDSYPNKWFIENAAGADFVIHECFLPPAALAKYFGWDMVQATQVSTRIHTEPAAFGKIMSQVKPRLAVGYHSVLIPELYQELLEGVRSTYDGPLTIASDLYVWNITKESIEVREAAVLERPYPPPVSREYIQAPRSGASEVSEYIMSGRWEGYTPPPMPQRR
jgi:ribonuclease Z